MGVFYDIIYALNNANKTAKKENIHNFISDIQNNAQNAKMKAETAVI